MRNTVAICLVFLAASSAWAEDLFIGSFESETRENFGSSTPGEYRIEVALVSKDRYLATMFHRGHLLGKKELVTCPVKSEGYLSTRAPGRAEVLCFEEFHSGAISYSENGIVVTVIKPKYSQNPGLVAQEGLKPGDPSLFEPRLYKAKYYAHIAGFFYGFRKVGL
jgi:hypothetical protein